MRKIDDLRKQLQSIENEIKEILSFRDTVFLRKFRRQLEGEKSFIREQIAKLGRSKELAKKEHLERIGKANRNRSTKMKRNWNYYRDIQKNYYPDKSLKEIRRLHKMHRQGLETDVPDLVWKNPSP